VRAGGPDWVAPAKPYPKKAGPSAQVAWQEVTMNRHARLLALVLGVLLAGSAGAGPDPEPAAVLGKLATQRRDAARKTYEVKWTNYRERRAPEDTLYLWSVRWLESEKQLSDQKADQVAAYKAHWERMRELERLLDKLQRNGVTTVDEVSAAEYYRAEAEVWLLQAREEKKKP
jgi:hypothetical protein